MQRTYVEIGLPVAPELPWRVRHLMFSPSARILLVLLAPSLGGDPRRLFVRGLEENQYREVMLPDATSILRLVTSEGAPVAFALVVADADPRDLRVLQVALPGGVVTELPRVQSDGVSRRVWLSELLSASNDGENLHVLVGCEPFPDLKGSTWVDYKLATFTVATGTFHAIASMLMPSA